MYNYSTSNQIPSIWSDYIGSIWADYLANQSFVKKGIIVELGPGYTDKVGIGLARMDFQGTLYVVDSNKEALRFTVNRYRKILVKASIVSVALSIDTANRELPDKIDCLLMNHILDDLVLYSAISPSLRDNVFGNMHSFLEKCQPEVISTWQQLFLAPSKLERIAQTVLRDLLILVNQTNPTLFGASQYKSCFLERNNLYAVNEYCSRLLQILSQDIGQTASNTCEMLLKHGQDPTQWLLVDRSSDLKIYSRSSTGSKE